MQVAGNDCVICDEKVLVETLGTWCARCNSILCLDCADPSVVCPGCGKTWDSPKQYFVYSTSCFQCFSEVGKQEKCECSGKVRWMNQGEYAAFAEERYKWAVRSGGVSLGFFALGTIVLVGSIMGFGIVGIGPFLAFLSVPLYTKGILRLRRGRKTRRVLAENG